MFKYVNYLQGPLPGVITAYFPHLTNNNRPRHSVVSDHLRRGLALDDHLFPAIAVPTNTACTLWSRERWRSAKFGPF